MYSKISLSTEIVTPRLYIEKIRQCTLGESADDPQIFHHTVLVHTITEKLLLPANNLCNVNSSFIHVLYLHTVFSSTNMYNNLQEIEIDPSVWVEVVLEYGESAVLGEVPLSAQHFHLHVRTVAFCKQKQNTAGI